MNVNETLQAGVQNNGSGLGNFFLGIKEAYQFDL